MTFKIVTRGDSSAPILAEYLCPVHGAFERLVERPTPDEVFCSVEIDEINLCGLSSTWTITAAPFGKVRGVEVERGGWQKPDNPGWLDTRDLGEGMPLDEWRAKRAKIRDEQRRKDLKGLVDG